MSAITSTPITSEFVLLGFVLVHWNQMESIEIQGFQLNPTKSNWITETEPPKGSPFKVTNSKPLFEQNRLSDEGALPECPEVR